MIFKRLVSIPLNPLKTFAQIAASDNSKMEMRQGNVQLYLHHAPTGFHDLTTEWRCLPQFFFVSFAHIIFKSSSENTDLTVSPFF